MKPIWKIIGLLFLLVLLTIIYSMISETRETMIVSESFIEGNEYMDCQEKVKDEIAKVLNTPIATTSNTPRMTSSDILEKIKKIENDVKTGTGAFEGNTKKCFPKLISMTLMSSESTTDVDEKIQAIRRNLTLSNSTSGLSTSG